jgi:hypothetical protein
MITMKTTITTVLEPEKKTVTITLEMSEREVENLRSYLGAAKYSPESMAVYSVLGEALQRLPSA